MAATAPIRPLAWEPSNAEGAALEKAKRKKKKKTALRYLFTPPRMVVMMIQLIITGIGTDVDKLKETQKKWKSRKGKS